MICVVDAVGGIRGIASGRRWIIFMAMGAANLNFWIIVSITAAVVDATVRIGDILSPVGCRIVLDIVGRIRCQKVATASTDIPPTGHDGAVDAFVSEVAVVATFVDVKVAAGSGSVPDQIVIVDGRFSGRQLTTITTFLRRRF